MALYKIADHPDTQQRLFLLSPQWSTHVVFTTTKLQLYGRPIGPKAVRLCQSINKHNS